jgi:hypothetical protein
LLPGLLQSPEPGVDHTGLPGICRLLSRAELLNPDARRFEQVALDWFNVNQADDASCAAILGAPLDGVEMTLADAAMQLRFRADPVYQQIDMHSVLLGDPTLLELSNDEAQALVESLNEHLAGDALQLTVGAAQRWYLHTARELQLRSTDLTTAIGHNIAVTNASGTDAGQWQRLLTECQMILFDHPVNRAREQRGQLPVNSLWLWGEGNPQAAAVDNIERQVVGDDFYTRSLARFTSSTWLEQTAADFSKPLASLFVDRRLQTAQNTGDKAMRRLVLEELDHALFAPLWKMLGAASVAEVRLWTGRQWWRTDYRARRRFWLRLRPFDTFLEPADAQ